MGEHEESRIRQNAARLALACYSGAVVVASFGLFRLISGDSNSAVVCALSCTFLLVSAIISTMRTRGY